MITLKSRDITLSTKVHLVKAMVCPMVMYECESWTVKKAEHQRIDAFELWRQALSGHERRIPLAVVLPPPARGAGMGEIGGRKRRG